MNTEQCRKWLTTDPKTQQAVKDRSGVTDFEESGEPDAEFDWVKWGKTPSKWVRDMKFKVGSKTDTEFLDYGNNPYVQQEIGVDPVGGVIRIFTIKGTDRVSVVILEKDDQLYFVEDMCD